MVNHEREDKSSMPNLWMKFKELEASLPVVTNLLV